MKHPMETSRFPGRSEEPCQPADTARAGGAQRKAAPASSQHPTRRQPPTGAPPPGPDRPGTPHTPPLRGAAAPHPAAESGAIPGAGPTCSPPLPPPPPAPAPRVRPLPLGPAPLSSARPGPAPARGRVRPFPRGRLSTGRKEPSRPRLPASPAPQPAVKPPLVPGSELCAPRSPFCTLLSLDSVNYYLIAVFTRDI